MWKILWGFVCFVVINPRDLKATAAYHQSFQLRITTKQALAPRWIIKF